MSSTSRVGSLRSWRVLLVGSTVAALVLSACGSSDDDTSTAGTPTEATESSQTTESTADVVEDGESTSDDGENTTPAVDGSSSKTGVDVGLFFDGALAGDPTTEDCTLSDGTETTCYRITVAG